MSSFESAVLITGSTSGLGRAAALQLAKEQPRKQIIVTGRSQPAAEDELTKSPNVRFVSLDLSTKAGTRDFVARLGDTPPLSALVFNAGLQVFDASETADGIESMMAVNQVNQSLLLFLLAPRLTPEARLVFVGSSAHDPSQFGSPQYKWSSADKAAHPDLKAKGQTSWGKGMERYGSSKFAGLLFASAVSRRSPSRQVLSLDPGVMGTGLYRSGKGVVSSILNFAFRSGLASRLLGANSAQQSGDGLSKLVSDAAYASPQCNGKYYKVVGDKMQEAQMTKATHDVALQDDLWSWTLKEVAADDAEAQTFEKALTP